MSSSESSYKQIIKSTGIFGSSQLINVILGIIRSKLTALFLGTMGVGILGLLQSVIDLTRSVSGLGLDSGATKNIATVSSKNNKELQTTLYTVNVWYLITAVLGALFSILFAKSLSIWAFDSSDYTLHIVALSIAVFFTALTAGITASLQGLRKIPYMALASTFSSVLTLLAMIPIYYYWGIKGIVPMLILSTIIIFLVSFYFYGKLKIKPIRIPSREVLKGGKKMLKLGAFIVVAGILSTASLFLVRSYINRVEGIDSVGLFQAAWVITTLFWGIVLRSANTDFFPKLCSLIDDRVATKQFVNEQTHILLLIISPLIIGLVTFSEYILHLLYTSDFTVATNVLRWHLIGAFFKMAVTPMATIMLAKNRGGVHLFCESVFWITYLAIGYFLYPIMNLEAIGVAYLVAYLIYLPTVLFSSYQLTKTLWSPSILKIVLVNTFFIAVLYSCLHYYSEYGLLVGTVLLFFSLVFSLYQLRAVINIREVIEWIRKRF